MGAFKPVVAHCLVVVILSLLQSKSRFSVDGAVVISPSPRAEVCHVGDSLEVTCNITNSSESILQWRVDFPSELGMTTHLSAIVTISTMHDQTTVLDSIIFTFSRSSGLRVSPLSSVLFIGPVRDAVNGTRISCSEGLDTNTGMTVDTAVFIIGNSPAYHLETPDVSVVFECFGTDNVGVTLRWANQLETSLLTHHVYIEPSSDVTIISTSNMLSSANLTLSYNVLYILRVESNICGQHNVTTYIELYYVICGDPLNEEMKNSSLVMTSYKALALEGSSVNFTCADGLVVGPNATTCMSNGEWEPDPREVKCKVNCNPPPTPTSGYILPYSSTLEGANVTYVLRDDTHVTATCNRNGNWELNFSDIMCTQTSATDQSPNVKITIGSSVTVLALSTVLFFAIGFVSGHFCHKQRKSDSVDVVTSPPPHVHPTIPLYDEVLPKDSEVQMETNSAYVTFYK